MVDIREITVEVSCPIRERAEAYGLELTDEEVREMRESIVAKLRSVKMEIEPREAINKLNALLTDIDQINTSDPDIVAYLDEAWNMMSKARDKFMMMT